MASDNEVRLQLKGGRSIKIVRTETPTGYIWSIPEMPEIAAHQNISVIRARLRGKGLIASRPGEKDTMALSNASATMLQEAMLKYGNKAKKADLIAWLVVYEMMTHPERFKDAEVENAIANLKLAGGKFRDKNSRPGAKDKMAVEDRFYFGK